MHGYIGSISYDIAIFSAAFRHNWKHEWPVYYLYCFFDDIVYGIDFNCVKDKQENRRLTQSMAIMEKELRDRREEKHASI